MGIGNPISRLLDLVERAHSSLTGIGTDDHHAQAHTLASHSTKAHSELTGVGTSDHHVKYTDAEALAAAVQAGAITDTVTKAPTHDAVYDVKTTADAAIAKSLLTERGSVIFRNATVPAELLHGTAGQALLTGGDGADPSWNAPAPAAHKTAHQDGGVDEISAAGLSGELADRQKSKVGASELGWTSDKLLKGAGAGVNPTEISVPVGAYTQGVRVYHDADQSIPNTTWTTLAFDSERYDTDTIHDVVTNNSRLTCKTAGIYLIIFHGYFASNTTGYRAIRMLLNGADIITYVETHMGSDGYWRDGVSTIYNLAVNDYVEIQVVQSSGGALAFLTFGNYSPEFMMQKIG